MNLTILPKAIGKIVGQTGIFSNWYGNSEFKPFKHCLKILTFCRTCPCRKVGKYVDILAASWR